MRDGESSEKGGYNYGHCARGEKQTAGRRNDPAGFLVILLCVKLGNVPCNRSANPQVQEPKVSSHRNQKDPDAVGRIA